MQAWRGIASSMVLVSESCLTKISQKYPDVNTSTVAVWHLVRGNVYIAANLGVMCHHAERLADLTKGTYFICYTTGYVSQLSAEPMGITYTTGCVGVFADDYKAERILVDQPWA